MELDAERGRVQACIDGLRARASAPLKPDISVSVPPAASTVPVPVTQAEKVALFGALADLLQQESLPAFERRLKRYTRPALLSHKVDIDADSWRHPLPEPPPAHRCRHRSSPRPRAPWHRCLPDRSPGLALTDVLVARHPSAGHARHRSLDCIKPVLGVTVHGIDRGSGV